MNLYQLVQEFKDTVAQLEELELDQEVLSDTLDSLTLPIEEKVENVVKYMKSLEALADAKKAEAKRLSESASSDLKKAEFFKNYIANNLQAAGMKELQAGIFKIGFRKGSEVVQVDTNKVPSHIEAPELYKVFYEFSTKTELKKLVQEGKEIPGVSLVRNPDTLQIK